ncbi:hypothetical protein EPN83_03035 [Patescibacteria group bacterium]|nr:MAG: hypothetical protein EPN83_03035 [Patescibacteria group bacterium]
MPYQVYTTEAFVLRGTPSGEADKNFLLLSRDFGMVHAYAQGARALPSKLRPNLLDFSQIRVSLVRGRERWRIVNAELSRNFFQILRSSPVKLCVMARLFSFLRSRLHGEERNPELFTALEAGLAALGEKALTEGEIQAVEYITLARILFFLGYLRADENLSPLLSGESISSREMARAGVIRRSLIRTINQGIAESER